MKKTALLIILVYFVLYAIPPIYGYAYKTHDYTNRAVSAITSHIQQTKNNVSRGDCISAIMKLIGMEQDAADFLNYNAAYDQAVFLDEYEDVENRGYIIQAIESNIAFGVKNELDGRCYFAPNKNVSIKECLTFMLRCLNDYENVNWDNNIIELSVEFGLLTHEEAKNLNFDESLTISMFKTLLERMMNLERYLYWQADDEAKYPGLGIVKVSQSQSGTYIFWYYQSH